MVMCRTSALVLLSLGLTFSGKEVIATSRDTKMVDAYIFADNFFELYVNGDLVSSDSRFIPHTAFQSTLNLNRGRENVIAVYLRENADLTTGLQYGNRCIGDGGFRFRALDDSIVSNSSWKCRTVHYGPINPEQCYGLGLDTTGRYSVYSEEDGGIAKTFALARPTKPISACRDARTPVTEQQQGFYYEPCETLLLPWFGDEIEEALDGKTMNAEWMCDDYDDSFWDSAVEFPEITAGWGVTPGDCSSGIGSAYFGNANDETWGPARRLPDELIGDFAQDAERPDSAVVPAEMDWGDSKFIWRPSLRFDNQIACRTKVYVESVNKKCSNGFTGVENDGVCCRVECGTCGGTGCRSRAEDAGLTADDCCVQRIKKSGRFCDETGSAPCQLDKWWCEFERDIALGYLLPLGS